VYTRGDCRRNYNRQPVAATMQMSTNHSAVFRKRHYVIDDGSLFAHGMHYEDGKKQ